MNDLRRVSEKTIFMKVYYFSNVSLCPEWGLDDSQNYCFYNNLISVNSKFVEKEVFIIAEDFNEHVEGSVKDYEEQHGSYRFAFKK